MANDWTLASASRAWHAGTVSARELTEDCLARIDAMDERTRAFVTTTPADARATAAAADAERQAGHDRGPLHGMPLALKDLVETRGVLTTAGSAVLADNIPDADATIVTRLRESGAVMLGKTNTHEFAWGVFTPPTRNPWNLQHIPGGSSGGSAVAVACGMALGAIGTDTGGSIRIPAACCGVSGHKPTFGLVPLEGIIPLSTSLDHAGPIARTMEDCALMLDVLAPRPAGQPSYAAASAGPIDDLRLAVLGGVWEASVDAEVLAIVRTAIAAFGAAARAFVPPEFDHAELFAAYRGIQGPEASVAHAERGWYPDRAERYTPLTRERLARAAEISGPRYVAAQRLRARYTRAWEQALIDQAADILLAPTIAIPAPPADAVADPARAPEFADGLLRLTFPFDMTGWPASSVLCGFTTAGLPVGLQIIGPAGADAVVLRVGRAFQARTDWHNQRPSLA